MWQMGVIVWDLMAWLPLDYRMSTHETGTGLSGGDRCWHGVFGQEMFAFLLREIVGHPANLVMLQLRRREQ